MLALALVVAAIQQPTAPPLRSPIARVEVQPAEAAIQVGQSIRLSATAYDSAGRVVMETSTKWFASGGFFEGSVDSTGLVTGGATGTVTVTALVRVPAGGPPATGLARVTVLPLPATKLIVIPDVSRLYVGQAVTLSGEPYAENDDRRYDRVTWSSSRAATAAVTRSGRLTGMAPGRATITARAGNATTAFTVDVAYNPVTSIQLVPATAEVRTGDVVRFTFGARTAAGKAVPDARAEWSLAPGGARIDDDGVFVAEEPGTYRVIAGFAGRIAEAQVEARPRDARRRTPPTPGASSTGMG